MLRNYPFTGGFLGSVSYITRAFFVNARVDCLTGIYTQLVEIGQLALSASWKPF